MTTPSERFDAILIGSGIGSLSAASILSQLYKKKVLVLERHAKLGGFTHVFKRQGKFEWDVGLHYVGEMAKGLMSRAMFDFVTGGNVRWQPMPDVYDVFQYPGFTFRARSGRSQLRSDLKECFPGEVAAIDAYFRDVKLAAGWLGRHVLGTSLPRLLAPMGSLAGAYGTSKALQTTGSYLAAHIRDARLRAVLASQWGNYGMPPSRSAFALHAMIASHYMDGAYYPIGGASSIASAVKPIIEAAGGQVLVNHLATEILLEDNRAVGVRAVQQKVDPPLERVFTADVIISGIGALLTYTKLLPTAPQIPYRKEIERFPRGTSNVTVYVGFKDDPSRLGLNGENYWMYDSIDHDEVFESRNALIGGKARHCFLSFPSLKNPQASTHTAEIIAFVDPEPFVQWSSQPVKKRGQEYEHLKGRIADALLGFVDERIPGFRNLVEYVEVSTPLTTEHYTGHPGGTIYGIPGIPERYRMPWVGFRTPIPNLFMAGADTSVHGIAGAMMSGAVTAGIAMGVPTALMHIFRAAKGFSASLPG